MFSTILILIVGSFVAGFADSVAGGGGLIQLPMLLLVFPHIPFPILAGTNKIASLCGTTYAAVRYNRAFALDRVVILSIPTTLFGSWLGARSVSYLDPSLIKPIVVIALLIVGVYTALKKNLGATRTTGVPSLSLPRLSLRAGVIGFALGLYDGFIGPGTGSFLIFAFILFLGFDFLVASANAKVINIATNLAAAVYFVRGGHFLAVEALAMAGANLGGAYVGSHMALNKGNAWIRRVFLLIISLLLARLSFETLTSYF